MTRPYIIARHGSNAANQHMKQVRDLCVVVASSAEAAIEEVERDQPFDVFVNQVLRARAARGYAWRDLLTLADLRKAYADEMADYFGEEWL